MATITLRPEPLTAAAFAPFGDVIEIADHPARSINQGTCERFDDLAQVDVLAQSGRPMISIFRSLARPLPMPVKILERHPLSSQAIIPLDGLPFLVIVAASGEATAAVGGVGHDVPPARAIRAFYASGAQGINYRRNTWHHALIALQRTCHFLVVDRGGPGENCDEVAVADAVMVADPAD